MKGILIFCLVSFSFAASGQDSLQHAKIKSLQGKIAPFSVFAKKDSLFLFCFWSVSSDESIAELNSINAKLEQWQQLTSFRFMAVSIDEGKAANRLRPVYNQNGWTFEAYADLYGELRK